MKIRLEKLFTSHHCQTFFSLQLMTFIFTHTGSFLNIADNWVPSHLPATRLTDFTHSHRFSLTKRSGILCWSTLLREELSMFVGFYVVVPMTQASSGSQATTSRTARSLFVPRQPLAIYLRTGTTIEQFFPRSARPDVKMPKKNRNKIL